MIPRTWAGRKVKLASTYAQQLFRGTVKNRTAVSHDALLQPG